MWRPLLALAALSCAAARAPAPAPRPAPASPGTSNILRADYAGSHACAGCHADLYDAFSVSPMHNMTRTPPDARVRAPWNGRSFHFKDDAADFVEAGGDRFLRVESRRFGRHVYRVTRIIGGRYREDYAGIEVDEAQPGARPRGDPMRELILPASYVFSSGSFRLKGYSVMVAERPGLRAGGVWNQTCILCHNT